MRILRALSAATLAVALSLAGATAAIAAPVSSAPQFTVPGNTTSPGGLSHVRTAGPLGAPNPLTSNNWSGYETSGGGTNFYTTVTTSWVMPGVVCNNRGSVALWAGLDGAQFGNFTVEQTGATADCSSGSPRYFAWYETFNSVFNTPAVNYTDPVVPGDNLTATVTVTGNRTYNLFLHDLTQGWTHNTPVTAPTATQNSSAEVIVEAPSTAAGEVPLPDFGFAGFIGTTIDNVALANMNPAPVNMADPAGGTDVTSTIAAGGNFNLNFGNDLDITAAPEIAYSAPGGELSARTPSGSGFAGQFLPPGVSPSITALPGGGWEGAFQSKTGRLIVYGTAFTFNTQLGMAAGTSPSIAAAADGSWEVAFQADTGQLYLFTLQNGGVPQGFAMLPGTSPSIAALANGGYETAFQGSDHDLFELGAPATGDAGLGMLAGTSPSIAASPAGDFLVAFQANTGQLWTDNATDVGALQGNAMAAGTSPSITALAAGGYEIAFQTNTHLLWEVGNVLNFNTTLGMAPGTSPSIAAVPGIQFQVAFQANTGQLWTQDLSVGGRSTGLPMLPNTNPSIVQ